jgi:hypothetical protein
LLVNNGMRQRDSVNLSSILRAKYGPNQIRKP